MNSNEITTLVWQKGTCQCGHSLTSVRMQRYDHKGGIELDEFDVPQWIYFTCPKCDYQNAFWKILRRIETLQLMRVSS